MMSIMNNVLAAYRAGSSSILEDKQILDELANNDNFAELLDVMDEVDAINGMDELRNEFNEPIDDINMFEDYKTNVK